MKKRLTTVGLAAALVLGMVGSAFAAGWQKNDTGWWYGTNADNTTWYANGWQWIDGNSDGIAQSYYFDASGYLYTNTTTPDGYTVNADGAWTENGVVQTKAVSSQTGSTVGVDTSISERFVESEALPNTIIPTNGLQGTYHLSREVFENYVAQSPNKQPDYVLPFGNWIENCYYTLNGEKFTLGQINPMGIRKSGKWIIDTSMPDAMNGKTNIRYRYDDGTWAGLGFHDPKLGENAQVFRSINDSPEAMLYARDWNTFFFTEDGYLMRNCYIDDDYAEVPVRVGCEGGWIDRNY